MTSTSSASNHPPSLLRLPSSATAKHRPTLLLRPPHPRDAKPLVAALHESLPELKAFMSWSHHPQTEESQYTRLVDVQTQYWGGQDMVFHIWSEEDEQLLGSIGLHHLRPLHPRGREIGYWVRTSATGQGVASRAAMALVAWGFGHQGYLRMQCGFNRSNTASRRVSEKVGFRHEAELTLAVDPPTEAMKRDGAIDDPISYQTVLLAQDIPQLPWYPELLGRLEVFDWCKERVSLPSKGD